MRRYWTRWLPVLVALILATSWLLFQNEIYLRYHVGQASAGLPAPIGASMIDRRTVVDTTCGAAGTIARYAIDRPWEDVATFFERYAHALPWQGGSWTADALDFYWPFPGDDMRELRLNVALDRGNPYVIPALASAYDGARAAHAAQIEPEKTTYLVQIVYVEDKTVSPFECARRHNADVIESLTSDLRRCISSFTEFQGCVRE
jgi:hypothetical protein